MKTTCPRCSRAFDQHPLSPERHTLCPSCRDKQTWDEAGRRQRMTPDQAPVALVAAAYKKPQILFSSPGLPEQADCG